MRCNEMIRGITIVCHEYLINQLADDSFLCIKSEDSFVHAFDWTEQFGLYSGLK